MGLRHAVLASLLEGEATGYELSKRFHVSVANYWSATSQQVYRELERLKADGHVSGRVVEQERRPNKRVFSLTAAGRDELHAFIREPTRPPAVRDDLLVKLQAATVDDLDELRRIVEERLERARDKLAGYERLRERLLEGDTHPRHPEEVGPYLVLMGGHMYEEQNIRWCTTVLAALDEVSR
jgi:DNA-binding PadR family transcriptional regulator